MRSYYENPPVMREYLYKTETVITQGLQATGTALTVGVLATIAGYYFRWREPLLIAGVIAAAVWVVTWVILQREWLNSVTIRSQTYQAIWTGEEDREPEPEAEPVREVRVRFERVRDGGHWSESVYPLPGSIDQMQALAGGLARGLPFSERAWTGGGRPFSLAEFRALRAEMIKRGLLEMANDKDQRQGYHLTEEGRAVMDEFMGLPSPSDRER
jgi:Zn-dependent protease with chaperone function